MRSDQHQRTADTMIGIVVGLLGGLIGNFFVTALYRWEDGIVCSEVGGGVGASIADKIVAVASGVFFALIIYVLIYILFTGSTPSLGRWFRWRKDEL